MFMSKVISKIYHIRKYDNIDHEASKKSSTQIALKGQRMTYASSQVTDHSVEGLGKGADLEDRGPIKKNKVG